MHMNMYRCYCGQITEEQGATLKLPLLLYASIIIILTRGASKIFLTRNKQWRAKHMKARRLSMCNTARMDARK